MDGKAADDKAKKIRQKRILEIIPAELIEESELGLTEIIQNSLAIRVEAFEENERTIDDLADYFTVASKELKNRILPLEKRRYVIYLRKSTDDEAKQVRSIDDQRDECMALALDVMHIDPSKIEVLEESASAKVSGNRPIFDDMLQGFRTGKYHGLISWSPDRISRNMKEAGEIIEMIDHETIQDLQFKTYQFENTPNGKMMLGILFATSKQYSDKLAVDVKRGTDGNIKDGKYNGAMKKGYYVDASNNYFVPDAYNWGLLRVAVDMRLNENKSNVEIAEFLNSANLSTRKDQDEEYIRVKVSKQMVGNIFEDSFYCGLYQYGNNIVNLMDIYNFVPLITPDEYILLNNAVASDFGKQTNVKTNRNMRLDYGLLRNKVICDYCDVPMQFQHQIIKRGKNTGKWLISYYCRNTACLRHNKAEQQKQGIKLSKSIRAKYIMSAIEWQLRHATKKSEQAYRMYIDKLETRLATERAITTRKLQEAKQDLRSNEKQYMKYQDFQVNNADLYKKHHHGKLEHHQQLMQLAEDNIEDDKHKLEELKTALPTEQEFYELIKLHLLDLLELNDITKLDAICNELVTNLRAANDSIPVIKLNPPYNLLVDLAEISSGRGDRIRTCDLSVPNRARYQTAPLPDLQRLIIR
jgi:DNA invertase Pin-like site-specific DNA recombinase